MLHLGDWHKLNVQQTLAALILVIIIPFPYLEKWVALQLQRVVIKILIQDLLSTYYMPSTVLSNVEDNEYFIYGADPTCL